MIVDIEAMIVELLQAAITDVEPRNIRGVGDARTAINLDFVTPPSVLVEYNGETSVDQGLIGTALYRTTTNWSIYCQAASFSADVAGRLDTDESPQAIGAYNLLDAVFKALAGRQLPRRPDDQAVAWLLPDGVEPWGVTETYVVYKSRWRCPVTRLGATVT